MSQQAGQMRELKVIPVSGNTSIDAGVHHATMLDVTASAAVAITFPAAATMPNGFRVIVQRNAASSNDVSLSGGITTTLTTVDYRREYVCDGANWVLISSVVDAPSDGKQYARRDATWSEVATEAIAAATKDPTGFEDPTAVTVAYDSTARTITLTQTGGVVYWWRGARHVLASPWTSEAHTDAANTYYLSASGTTISWATTPWTFGDVAQFAIAVYRTTLGPFGQRECHGLMPWQVHEELHRQIGTYLVSGGLLTAGTYAIKPAAPADADNTPGVDVASIADEDLPTTIPALTEGTYTRVRNVSGAMTADSSSLPIRVTATYPNINSGGAEVEAASGDYLNVYAVLVPASADAGSQAFRILWVQPQSAHASLIAAQAEQFASLSLGDLTTILPEFVPHCRITYRCFASYGSTGKCRIEGVTYLTTTRSSVLAGPQTIAAANVGFTPSGSIAGLNVQTALVELDSEKAPLDSPALTGAPTAPTAAADTSTTQIATTAFAKGEADAAQSAAIAASDPAGTAAYAIASHVGASAPHTQYTTSAEAAAAAPVQSVNTKTGAVVLTASDVGADPAGSAAAAQSAAIAASAPVAHTHAVGNLTQSGAAVGQAPVWDGSAWVPADVAASVTLAGNREVATGKPPDSTDSRLRGPHTTQYLSNPDGEISNADWECYADAAGAVPVDGIGGTPTVTLTRTTSAPLRGAGSLLLTKDAANRQGEGAAIGFTIDAADCNRSLTISGICSISAGYVAGDVTIHVYNFTTGVRAPISGGNAINAGGAFSLQFTADANTSYRLCFHVASTNAAAWTLKLDDLHVGPAWAPSVGAMTDWQDGGAITIGATTTAPTKGTIGRDKVWWRRVGDSAEIHYEYEQTAAGANGSGEYLVSLPSGLSIDTSKWSTSTAAETEAHKYQTGSGGISNGSSRGRSYVVPYDATRFRVMAEVAYSSLGFWNSGYYQIGAGAVKWSMTVLVPIAGWSGSQAVQPGSRYLWAQRFAANAVRVTGAAPSKPGEYRALYNQVTDAAPTVPPSVANGVYFNTVNAAGNIQRYDIYVGPGKICRVDPYLSAGRTGIVSIDQYLSTAAVYYGCDTSYDPATGVFTVWCYLSHYCGHTPSSAGVQQIYFDILVADDPVAVALAPSVHVEASSDAGQAVTANTEALLYEDVASDTHGAWSGSAFTAPLSGLYAFAWAAAATAGQRTYLYIRGAKYFSATGADANQTSAGALVVRMAAGDIASVRLVQSVTRNTVADQNRLSITRIGDA